MTALSNASPAPGCIFIQQFYEEQKSSILIGENSLLPPAEHQSVISLSCKTMFIPDGVCLGTNTRSEMCTHLKTQTLHLILYLLVNAHCSQAPFQNTPTGRRKYFLYIYIKTSFQHQDTSGEHGTGPGSGCPRVPAPSQTHGAKTRTPDFIHLPLPLTQVFLLSCDAPQCPPCSTAERWEP